MKLMIAPNGRLYAPEIGRFLSRDPASEFADNLYVYVDNSPPRHVDPDGQGKIVVEGRHVFFEFKQGLLQTKKVYVGILEKEGGDTVRVYPVGVRDDKKKEELSFTVPLEKVKLAAGAWGAGTRLQTFKAWRTHLLHRHVDPSEAERIAEAESGVGLQEMHREIVQKPGVKEAARVTAQAAETLYKGMASMTVGGHLVVAVSDIADEGLSKETVLNALLATLRVKGALSKVGDVQESLLVKGQSKQVARETQRLAKGATGSWAQKTHSAAFRHGRFAGTPVEDVVEGLKAGLIKPEQVPIHYVRRCDRIVFVNTRSAIALKRAGIATNRWSVINKTGNPYWEKIADTALEKAKFPSTGTPLMPRQTGGGG